MFSYFHFSEITLIYFDAPFFSQQVTNEPVKCIRLLPAYSYTAVGFNSGLITIFTFVLVSQGFGKV